MDTRDMNLGAPFKRTLTILTPVISCRGRTQAVVDAGVKAMSGERGLPTVKDAVGLELTALHAERAPIEVDARARFPVEPGEKFEIRVYHSDATINLHSKIYGVRRGQVEEVFQIAH